MTEQLLSDAEQQIELHPVTDEDNNTNDIQEEEKHNCTLLKDDMEYHYDSKEYIQLSIPNGNEVTDDTDLETKPFDKDIGKRDKYRLFYFGGKQEKIFYEINRELPHKSNSDPIIFECECRNTERSFPWPETIYLTGEQLKTAQFVKSGSKTEKSVFNNYSLYGLKNGFIFCFENELIYIVDGIIKSNQSDYVYQCTKISVDEFPEQVYLTKKQFNDVNQLLGLDLLRSRAIYNEQQTEENKLIKLFLENNDIDAYEAELKLLRAEKMNWYFVINYDDKNEQIVYYVSDIENIDKFVCELSNKNGLDKLEAAIPYPTMIILNQNEMNELKTDGYSFDGTGCKLNFDDDIYSLYASFYFSNKHKQTYALCVITIFTFILQIVSVLAITWCFDVAYDEDVIKYYKINQFQQCGFEGIEANDTDTFIYNTTSFCLNLDNINSNGTFALIEQNAHTQQFVVSQSEWYILGYVSTAFVSLLILTFYIYKNAVGSIKLYVSLNYCDIMDRSATRKVKFLAFMNIFLILFAYAVGVWSITTYPINKGISDPFDMLALPISVVFVLEVDDWIYYIVKIGYTEYIKSSFGVEITKNALADFGNRSRSAVGNFFFLQVCTCYISLVAALFISDLNSDINDVVRKIFFQIIQGTFLFLFLTISIYILTDEGKSRKRKAIFIVVLAIYTLFVWGNTLSMKEDLDKL